MKLNRILVSWSLHPRRGEKRGRKEGKKDGREKERLEEKSDSNKLYAEKKVK